MADPHLEYFAPPVDPAAAAFAHLNEVAANQAAAEAVGQPGHTREASFAFKAPVIDPVIADAAAQVAGAGGGATLNQAPMMSTTGVGYTPGADPAAADDEGPVGTSVPYMTQAVAKQVVDQSAGLPAGGTAVMTPANRYAANMAKEVQAGMDSRTRGLAKKVEDVGAEQQFAAMSIADRTAAANEELDRVNAEQAKADEEQAKKTEAFQAQVEAGRKAWSDANKDFNPSRLLGDPGKRIGFTIATALGALGQAFLKGGPNTALQIINDALDRDIMQQKQDIAGKRENVSLLQQQLGEYRQAMGDSRAARLAAKANALEGLAGYTNQMKTRLSGTEGKLAADQVSFGLMQQADEARRQSYLLAAKPSGRAPMTPLERVEAEQKLMKGQLANRQTDVATQAAEAKANGKGAEGETDATTNRRGKLALQYEARNSAVRGLEQVREMIASDRQSAIGLSTPNLTNSEDAEKLITKVIADYARGRGGPVTASDQKISEDTNNIIPSLLNPATWSDGSALRRIDALLNVYRADRDAVFEGQNAGDVAAISKTLPRAKPTEEQIVKRFNAKKK